MRTGVGELNFRRFVAAPKFAPLFFFASDELSSILLSISEVE